MPTLDSTALDTTTGRPMSSAIRRQARTPPSGCTLSTAMSAASSSRTRQGSAARRIDSSAAIGTVTFPGPNARSTNEATGRPTHSKPPPPLRGPEGEPPAGGAGRPAFPQPPRPLPHPGDPGAPLGAAPPAVDVDAHQSVGAHRIADRLEPRLVLTGRLPGLGHLHLGR